MSTGDDETDAGEAALILLGGAFAIAFIVKMGYVPLQTATDVMDILPSFAALGLGGQAGYAIVAVLSVGTGAGHLAYKRTR